MSQRYFGNFTSVEDVLSQFEERADAVRDDQILFASYETPGYEGYALVLFYGDDGKLYEVNGSHCSCYGLEDQWHPEETSWEALAMRRRESEYGWDPQRHHDQDALRALVAARPAPPAPLGVRRRVLRPNDN